MSDIGMFWIGLGIAFAGYFIGSGLDTIGEKIEDAVIHYIQKDWD